MKPHCKYGQQSVVLLSGTPLSSSLHAEGSSWHLSPILARCSEDGGELCLASLQIANVIYLDSPSGVGLSYSETVTDYVTNDTQTALDTLTFLEAFFREFPEFSGHRFYITGDCLLLTVLNFGHLRYTSYLAQSKFMDRPFLITCPCTSEGQEETCW